MSFLTKLFGPNTAKTNPEGARRLARLLLSEIKLYETYKLERGIRMQSILSSLEDEIATARAKFRRSYDDDYAREIFAREIVAVLADDDVTLLGKSPN